MDPTDHDPADAAQLHRIVRCPACGGDSVYSPSNPARPFCSDRCKNMDFGAWASETFRVPTQVAPDELMFGETPRH